MSDTREINENESICLDIIETQLEEDITSWEIIKTENIYDDEMDMVYRGFTFNRGNEDYQIAIASYGEIKCVKKGIPSILLCEIANSLITLLNGIIDEYKTDLSQ